MTDLNHCHVLHSVTHSEKSFRTICAAPSQNMKKTAKALTHIKENYFPNSNYFVLLIFVISRYIGHAALIVIHTNMSECFVAKVLGAQN